MNKIVAVILVLTGIAIGTFLIQPSNAQTRRIELRYSHGYCFATLGESITYIKDVEGWRECDNLDKILKKREKYLKQRELDHQKYLNPRK